MNRTDSPKKQPVPFGVNGQREDLPASTPAGDNTASYSDGFPAVTMILKAAGGLPPKGQDMNQILFELSNLARWASAGALNSYDTAFASAIGGYPKGAVLIGDDAETIFISTSDGNQNNPSAGGTGWFNLSTGYLRSSNNLSDLPDKKSAKINLNLQSFNSENGLTTVSSPAGKIFLYLDDIGPWGVQDSAGHPLPLSIDGGGTGANTYLGARVNLSVQALTSGKDLTTLSSPNATVFYYLNDAGVWGVQDSAGNSIPLPIECGGTGERTLLGARVRLGVDVVGKTNLLTTLSSPDASRFLFITNGTSWGFQTSNGTAIPLPLSSGGLGAVNAEGGRNNLGLGVVATENVVPISKGGTNATTAASARTSLGLGSSATKNIGTEVGDVVVQGGTLYSSAVRISAIADYNTYASFLSTYQPTISFPGTGQGTIINAPMESNTQYSSRWLGDTSGVPYFQASINGSFTDAFKICAIGKTVTVDVNGFVKQASPIVRLFSDGTSSANEEAEGVTSSRSAVGVYKVKGSLGLNSDGVWTIEIPQDQNGNRLCFVDVKTDKTGTITVSVFKRKFDIDTAMVVAGDPMDIPADRGLDLRLDMPEDSVYNRKMKEAAEAIKASASESDDEQEGKS